MPIGSYLSEFYLSSAWVVATISKAPELFKIDLAPMLILNHNYKTHLHGTYTYIQYTINLVSLSLSMGVKDMICVSVTKIILVDHQIESVVTRGRWSSPGTTSPKAQDC